jgi:hypothetical protein
MSDFREANNIIERLRQESDQCQQDGAADIVLLLDDAAMEIANLIRRLDNAERRPVQPAVGPSDGELIRRLWEWHLYQSHSDPFSDSRLDDIRPALEASAYRHGANRPGLGTADQTSAPPKAVP